MKILKINKFIFLIFIGIFTFSINALADNSTLSLEKMENIVNQASAKASIWDGPISGPEGQLNKKIAVICEDLRNGGVLGVAEGVGEAAKFLKWDLKILDAKGTKKGRIDKLKEALSMNVNGVILIGSDANSLKKQLSQFKNKNIPLVGWHVSSVAGKLPSGNVAINVSTNPFDVAKITAMAAIVESKSKAGVVIFTDSNFEIAMKKANAMADIIKKCKTCKLLEIKDLAISKSAKLMPKATKDLLKKYGNSWTHALAINDIYFDYAAPELTKEGKDIHLYSAGDGSSAAFLRIQAKAFQYGTVAEPLNLQGWQLVDELNRLLAGESVSGYIIPVHLVTTKNVIFDGGDRLIFDPDNGYKSIYRAIWKR
jgi:ribose transport system substrate-binding protein